MIRYAINQSNILPAHLGIGNLEYTPEYYNYPHPYPTWTHQLLKTHTKFDMWCTSKLSQIQIPLMLTIPMLTVYDHQSTTQLLAYFLLKHKVVLLSHCHLLVLQPEVRVDRNRQLFYCSRLSTYRMVFQMKDSLWWTRALLSEILLTNVRVRFGECDRMFKLWWWRGRGESSWIASV